MSDDSKCWIDRLNRRMSKSKRKRKRKRKKTGSENLKRIN